MIRTLRRVREVKLRVSWMQAGLTDTLWDIERLYDEVSGQTWRDEESRRIAWAAAMLH